LGLSQRGGIMGEEKPFLADEILKDWLNRKVVVSINGDQLFSGVLRNFDDEVIILENVTDFTGNKGKALLVKIDEVHWIMLLE